MSERIRYFLSNYRYVCNFLFTQLTFLQRIQTKREWVISGSNLTLLFDKLSKYPTVSCLQHCTFTDAI